jgi:hypothetical protein
MKTFEEKLKDTIKVVIMGYIDDVSCKYNISRKELESMWMKHDGDEVKVETVKKDYDSMKKNELVQICKELGINDKGNKKDLIKRVLNKKEKGDNIVEKLDMSLNSIMIKKNKFGNFVHTSTSFVFNKETKSVIGKEDEDGNIIQLDRNDINICNKYKFKYTIPDDLNANKDNNENEEIVDEISDEEISDEEISDEEDDD